MLLITRKCNKMPTNTHMNVVVVVATVAVYLNCANQQQQSAINNRSHNNIAINDNGTGSSLSSSIVMGYIWFRRRARWRHEVENLVIEKTKTKHRIRFSRWCNHNRFRKAIAAQVEDIKKLLCVNGVWGGGCWMSSIFLLHPSVV